MKKDLHQPTLSTIRFVEQKLKKKKYFRSRNQLFLSLGKSVMYPTITTILDYLEESNKIAFKKDSSIIWTFSNSRKIKKSTKHSKRITRR
jgi:hypothetical protein